jgi:hypothetical protein
MRAETCIGNALHAVGDARDEAEELRDAPVHALAQRLDAFAQGVARRSDELRVRREEGTVARHVAAEAGVTGHGLDLALQPRHFGQAQRVHFVGVVGGAGEVPHPGAVVRGAGRTVHAAERFARAARHQAFQEVGPGLQSRHQGLANHAQGAVGLGQHRGLRGSRRALERRQPGRGFGRGAQDAPRVGHRAV